MFSECLVDLQGMGMRNLSWECQLCQLGCFGMTVRGSLFPSWTVYIMRLPFAVLSKLNLIGNASGKKECRKHRWIRDSRKAGGQDFLGPCERQDHGQLAVP